MAKIDRRDKIPVVFTPEEEPQKQGTSVDHHEVGVSALYGRVNNNVTHVTRGIYSNKPWSSVFPGAYFEVVKVIGKFFRIFIGR